MAVVRPSVAMRIVVAVDCDAVVAVGAGLRARAVVEDAAAERRGVGRLRAAPIPWRLRLWLRRLVMQDAAHPGCLHLGLGAAVEVDRGRRRRHRRRIAHALGKRHRRQVVQPVLAVAVKRRARAQGARGRHRRQVVQPILTAAVKRRARARGARGRQRWQVILAFGHVVV